MNSIELLIEQITLEYKKHLPDWEFPNKEYYVEMHKAETKNLYTEEQLREVIEYCKYNRAFDYNSEEILKSLKQPKKD
jgi:hypothetical protein